MLRSLAEQIRGSGGVSGIEATGDDLIPGAMLASFLNVPFGTGKGFSMYSDKGKEICVFKLNYASDHYNRFVRHCVEDLQVEDDNTYQRITLPWQK